MHTVRLEPHAWEPTGVSHEWDLLRGRVNVVVVGEFSGWQEICPVILLVVGEDANELFHLLVDALGLAISLWVVCCGGGWSNPDEAPELPGELCNELRTTIRDVLLWGAVVAPDISVVQLGGTHSVDVGRALIEVSTLPEDINCNHNCVIAMGLGELNDKVHRHGVPALWGDLSGVQLTDWELPERLGAAAQVAGRNISAYMSGQLRPPVVPGDKNVLKRPACPATLVSWCCSRI